jgi:endonuclease/exonuclease/phosphatase family metal-dependent hydrolase
MRVPRPIVAAALAMLASACTDAPLAPDASLRTDAPPAHSMAGGNKQLVVMSRNLYLGADLSPIFVAPSPIVLFDRAHTRWQTVLATRFAERAAAIAGEVAAANPELIGLQEVPTYYLQRPGDGFLGPLQARATVVELDFLATLLDALEARGLRYETVSSTAISDVEVMALPLGSPLSAGYDVRFQDHSAILARADVKATNPRSGIYAAYVPVSSFGSEIRVRRAWTSVDVKHRGEHFRFVSTHLENAVRIVQEMQAQELVAVASASPLPVVLVGDLNSPPDGSFSSTYAMVRGAGFADAWSEVGSGAGFTCCQSENLRNAASTLRERIDLVLYRGPIEAVSADVVGDEPGSRTATGLWPSDHAGLVATLRLR